MYYTSASTNRMMSPNKITRYKSKNIGTECPGVPCDIENTMFGSDAWHLITNPEMVRKDSSEGGRSDWETPFGSAVMNAGLRERARPTSVTI